MHGIVFGAGAGGSTRRYLSSFRYFWSSGRKARNAATALDCGDFSGYTTADCVRYASSDRNDCFGMEFGLRLNFESSSAFLFALAEGLVTQLEGVEDKPHGPVSHVTRFRYDRAEMAAFAYGFLQLSNGPSIVNWATPPGYRP